jgi:hypothetical protein
MAEHAEPIDISDLPELRRLAEEVQRTQKPRALTRDREVLAMVVPASYPPPRRRKERTQEDYEAFRSSAGGWKGLVDTDKLIEGIYESRRISSRPPVEL